MSKTDVPDAPEVAPLQRVSDTIIGQVDAIAKECTTNLKLAIASLEVDDGLPIVIEHLKSARAAIVALMEWASPEQPSEVNPREERRARGSEDVKKAVRHDLNNFKTGCLENMDFRIKVCEKIIESKSALNEDKKTSLLKYLNSMGASIKRLVNIILTVYDEEERFVPKTTELKGIASRITDILSDLNGSISLVEADDKPVYAYVDTVYIQRIIVILISNSMRFLKEKKEVDASFQGEINITLSSNNGFAVIEFADNGPGVSKSIKDRLFEEGASTQLDGEHGLGLNNVKRLVEKHGGTVELGNEGVGATFIIKLPQETVAQESVAQ
jgi:signal transduction histidine kinase